MANQKYYIIPEFKNSIVVPTGAGTEKWAKSNSEGKLEWSEPSFTYERTWGGLGEGKAETYPVAPIRVESGEKKSVVAILYRIAEGTSIKFELLKNGTAQELGGAKEFEAVSTELKEKTGSISLADKDVLDVVFKTPSGTPKIPSVTAVIKVTL